VNRIPGQAGRIVGVRVAAGDREHPLRHQLAQRMIDLAGLPFVPPLSEDCSGRFSRPRYWKRCGRLASCLRDSFAVGLLGKGVPLEEVSNLSGQRVCFRTDHCSCVSRGHPFLHGHLFVLSFF
jgi:hypothetical protein